MLNIVRSGTYCLLFVFMCHIPSILCQKPGACPYVEFRGYGDVCGAIVGYVPACEAFCHKEFGKQLVYSECRPRSSSWLFTLLALNPHDCFCCHMSGQPLNEAVQKPESVIFNSIASQLLQREQFPSAEHVLNGAADLHPYESKAGCAHVLNSTGVVCDFTSTCDGWSVTDTDLSLEVYRGSGVPSERTLWSLFGTVEPPSQTYLLVYAGESTSIHDVFTFRSCPIACTKSMINVTFRHWQSYGVKLELCFVEYSPTGEQGVQVCSPIYRPKNISLTTETLPAASNFMLSFRATGFEPGYVLLMDLLRVDYEPCEEKEAYEALANLVEEGVFGKPKSVEEPEGRLSTIARGSSREDDEDDITLTVCDGIGAYRECNKYCSVAMQPNFRGAACVPVPGGRRQCRCNPTTDEIWAATSKQEPTKTTTKKLRKVENQPCVGSEGLFHCARHCITDMGVTFERAECAGQKCICMEKVCYGARGMQMCEQECRKKHRRAKHPVTAKCERKSDTDVKECKCEVKQPQTTTTTTTTLAPTTTSSTDTGIIPDALLSAVESTQITINCGGGAFGQRVCANLCLKQVGPKLVGDRAKRRLFLFCSLFTCMIG